MKTDHTGSCLCGAVQFAVGGPFESFFLCHCKHCQKDTGSAHAANLFSKTATLEWTTGEEKVKTFTLPGTRHTKSFCMECGSALPYVLGRATLVVPAGSLNTTIELAPNAQIFYSRKVSWLNELQEIKTFLQLPE